MTASKKDTLCINFELKNILPLPSLALILNRIVKSESYTYWSFRS